MVPRHRNGQQARSLPPPQGHPASPTDTLGKDPHTKTGDAPTVTESKAKYQFVWVEGQIGSNAFERCHNYLTATPATLFIALFVAYNLPLHKLSTQNSFTVGTITTQYLMAQLQEVISLFTNILPIHTTIDDDMMFSEYLGTFCHSLFANLTNDEVAYKDVVSQTKSSSQGHSYFRHLFTPGGLHMHIIDQLNTSDITITSILSLLNGEEKYKFLLTIHYKTGKVILGFNDYLYSAHVLPSLTYTFDPSTINIFGTLSCSAIFVTGCKELVLGNIGKAVKSLHINVVHCTLRILTTVPLKSHLTLETVVAGEV